MQKSRSAIECGPAVKMISSLSGALEAKGTGQECITRIGIPVCSHPSIRIGNNWNKIIIAEQVPHIQLDLPINLVSERPFIAEPHVSIPLIRTPMRPTQNWQHNAILVYFLFVSCRHFGLITI